MRYYCCPLKEYNRLIMISDALHTNNTMYMLTAYYGISQSLVITSSVD